MVTEILCRLGATLDHAFQLSSVLQLIPTCRVHTYRECCVLPVVVAAGRKLEYCEVLRLCATGSVLMFANLSGSNVSRRSRKIEQYTIVS
jgi:hypothetical protein